MSIINAARVALAAALGLSASSALAQVRVGVAPSSFIVTPLYAFSGGADGGGTSLGMTASDGALYGTTLSGGVYNRGVVFKLSPPATAKSKWTETVLYTFSGTDGTNPLFTPTLDSEGALYGATTSGGANNIGVAFKLTPPVAPSMPWVETKIFDFTTAVGGNPAGTFVQGGFGVLYGIAQSGGANGYGTVYRLTPPVPPATQWTGAALYNFTGASDGGVPGLALAMDTQGALYGGTSVGGVDGFGVVFKLSPPGGNCTPTSPNLWCETVLYSFAGGADGVSPVGVTLDPHGALYGVANGGGFGQVFKLTPPAPLSTLWTKTTLYSFTGGADGSSPFVTPILVGGALYGTTPSAGGCNSCGAIYQLTPPVPPATQWTEKTLWTFTAGADDSIPTGLTFAPVNFGFGVAVYGVTTNRGQIFTLQCAPRARQVFGGDLRAVCTQ